MFRVPVVLSHVIRTLEEKRPQPSKWCSPRLPSYLHLSCSIRNSGTWGSNKQWIQQIRHSHAPKDVFRENNISQAMNETVYVQRAFVILPQPIWRPSWQTTVGVDDPRGSRCCKFNTRIPTNTWDSSLRWGLCVPVWGNVQMPSVSQHRPTNRRKWL